MLEQAIRNAYPGALASLMHDADSADNRLPP